MREGRIHAEKMKQERGRERVRLKDILQKTHFGGQKNQHRKMKNWETKKKDTWLH